jgi:Protein of unknown function (DUF3551)
MNPRIMAALFALATLTGTMMEPGAAQAAPYWPWCSRYDQHRSGAYQCAFVSFEQCMDTVRGVGGYCYVNPYPKPYTPAPGRLAKSRHHAAN